MSTYALHFVHHKCFAIIDSVEDTQLEAYRVKTESTVKPDFFEVHRKSTIYDKILLQSKDTYSPDHMLTVFKIIAVLGRA